MHQRDADHANLQPLLLPDAVFMRLHFHHGRTRLRQPSQIQVHRENTRHKEVH